MATSLQNALKPNFSKTIETQLSPILRSLTKEHLIFLNRDFPSALFPTVLGYPIADVPLCQEVEFNKLNEKLGLPFLYEHSLDLMLIVRDEGRKDNLARLERLIELLSDWNRPQDKSLLVDLKKTHLLLAAEPLRDRIDRARLRLSRLWNLPGQKLNEKWLELRALAPSCLSVYNDAFFEQIKKAVTIYRLQAMQKALRSQYDKTKKIQKDLTQLKPQGDPVLLRTLLDGWFRPFQFKGSGEKTQIYSQGSQVENKEDDIALSVLSP